MTRENILPCIAQNKALEKRFPSISLKEHEKILSDQGDFLLLPPSLSPLLFFFFCIIVFNEPAVVKFTILSFTSDLKSFLFVFLYFFIQRHLYGKTFFSSCHRRLTKYHLYIKMQKILLKHILR